MLLDLLKSRRETILALAQRYRARHVRVFGSVAREPHPQRDADPRRKSRAGDALWEI
jgi:uncharacterized protein